MKRIFVAILALVLSPSLPAMAQTSQTDLEIHAKDGTLLKATVYSPNQLGPGVLLLYNCQSDNHRGRFDRIARKLAAGGIHAMTFDYRGYGESGGEERGYEAQRPYRKTKWREDIRAAYHTLVSQPGVNSKEIGVVGAACGAVQGLYLAIDGGIVKSFVFLDGGADEEGKAFLSKAKHIPILGVADNLNARGGKVMIENWSLSTNPDKELVVYNQGGHGVEALRRHPELERRVVEWFKTHLIPECEE